MVRERLSVVIMVPLPAGPLSAPAPASTGRGKALTKKKYIMVSKVTSRLILTENYNPYKNEAFQFTPLKQDLKDYK